MIDLYENRELAQRLVRLITHTSKIGGRYEREETTEFDPETGTVYEVVWWDDMPRGGGGDRGYHATEVVVPTKNVLKMIYEKGKEHK